MHTGYPFYIVRYIALEVYLTNWTLSRTNGKLKKEAMCVCVLYVFYVIELFLWIDKDGKLTGYQSQSDLHKQMYEQIDDQI